MEKITIKSPENNLKTIKNDIDSLVFDEKIWINSKMWKIAEVTYSYYSEENFDLNITLFCDIWEANLDFFKKSNYEKRKEIILKSKEILIKKINNKQEKIDFYIKRLNNLKFEKKEEIFEKDIILNALEEKKDLLDYCLNWIPYELEKAWIKEKYNEEEINKKQNQIDKKIFGWNIKKNPEEIKFCYENLKTIFLKNKEKLNKKEQEKFLYFLDKITSFLAKNYVFKKIKEKKSLLKKYEKFKIKDKYYIPWFNLFIDALNSLDYTAYQDENVWSISDWPNSIEFPKNKKFDKLSLARILKLNAHEIETHSITDNNNSEIIWNIRWAKSIEKDEWLAIFMEYLLEYWNTLFKKDKKTWKLIIDKTKFKVSDSFTNILMWEILENNELLDFLKLKEKLKPGKISVKAQFLRLKRSNKSEVQHKDCSYIRWLFKLINEVNKYIISNWKKGIKFEDLFLWKAWFSEINKLKFIKEKLEKKEKLNIVNPIFASDTILFFLSQKEKNMEISEENFINYLNKKYPILDFSDKIIKLNSHRTKRNLLWILNIVSNDLYGNNKFMFMLYNSISRLWEKRKKISEKYLWQES